MQVPTGSFQFSSKSTSLGSIWFFSFLSCLVILLHSPSNFHNSFLETHIVCSFWQKITLILNTWTSSGTMLVVHVFLPYESELHKDLSKWNWAVLFQCVLFWSYSSILRYIPLSVTFSAVLLSLWWKFTKILLMIYVAFIAENMKKMMIK